MGRKRGSGRSLGLGHSPSSSSSSALSSPPHDDSSTTPDSQHNEHHNQHLNEEPGDIIPDSYSEPGGIPIFKPSMEEFESFPEFIRKINKYGMRSGIVKVIPPKEWVDELPDLSHQVDQVRIRHAIVQHINGFSGEYRQQNIEKQRGYTMQQWRELCESSQHLPPARRGQRRGAAATRSSSRLSKDKDKDRQSKKDFDYRFDDSEFTPERCRELEKIYWKTLTYNTPLYGADLPGSLFTNDTKTWNVAKLDNILNNINVDLPGVNKAYLYCGMWKSTFAWHLEDMDLYSINYLHFGAPKQWYSISQKDSVRFYNLMKSIWPGEQAKCSEFLRHKTFHASPSLLAQHGIKVNKLLHYQNEFVITFPYGYHAGFNYGYNCAESVNFAIEDWIDIGRKAKKCTCVNDSVGIDMDWFVRRLNGEPSDEEMTDDYDDDDDRVAGGSCSLLSPPLSTEDGNVRKRKRRRTGANATIQKLETTSTKPNVTPPTCALCPNSMDIETLKTEDGKFLVHRVCAMYTPETYFKTNVEENNQQVVMGLSRIPKARKDLKCLFCRSKYGACFQCSAPKCTRSYHATCAAPAGVYVDMGQNQDGDMTIEYRCRFHREKRPIDADLEANLEIETWAHKLTKGDVVQAQFQHGPTSIFAGIVRENNHSENTLLLDILPIVRDNNNNNSIEVEYKYLLLSGGGSGTFGSLPTKTTSLMEHDEPAKKHTDKGGINWDQVSLSGPLETIEQAPAQMDKFWYYLGDVSTDAYARYTDDVRSKVPNDPETVEQNARRIKRQQILAKRAESAAKAALKQQQQSLPPLPQPLNLATLQYYYELVKNNPALQAAAPALQLSSAGPAVPVVAAANSSNNNNDNNNNPLWGAPGQQHQVEPARE